jgi:hypothetical protein
MRAAAFLAAALATASALPAGAAGSDAIAPDLTAGVDQPPRRGAYAEAAVGAFTTLGGSRPFSLLQPYLGLTVGREIGAASSLFVSVGIGASSDSCFQPNATGCAASDSFGATFFEGGASFGVHRSDRMAFAIKAVGGMTMLSPGPFARGNGDVPGTLFAPHAGAGVSMDYDTHLDHFGVGVDALLRETLVNKPDGSGRTMLGSLALLPRVRYVF